MTRLFFDGDCGMCQSAVQFVARQDRSDGLRFAPLGGPTCRRLLPESVRTGLPDSLVVLTPAGTLLVRSDAVIHLLRRMGPAGRLGGFLLSCLPGCLRDWAYGLIAGQRSRNIGCARISHSRDDRFEP
ncbi:MAG: DUF393 domain-containing protein [Holophagaceae bacterium]|uniref:DUF393 domain-containing protein n=1 Tax=Candidatus Geothrix skivensis TaxID=2954439 RepID=A0A9D7SJE8_9BACT|nr:DUF393 domain-containing protein [Candidatus Geothrix skivensis]